jgi:hypothetical protein
MAKQKMTLFETKTLEKLGQIVDRLNMLIELSVPPPKTEGLSKTEAKVLEMCDMKNTANDMMKKLQKTRNAIDITLHNLRSKGLIRSIKVGKKTYHVRTR